MNVALYNPRGKRWAMTERGRNRLAQDRESLTIGRSTLSWDGAALNAEIDEVSAPIPRRIRGRVRVIPAALPGAEFSLSPDGDHRWQPIAPCARVEVRMTQPALSWSGPGYLDTNRGAGPLERSFTSWHWSRAPLPHGGAAILYEAERRQRAPQTLALRVGADGRIEPFEPPPPARLPRSLWRIERPTRSDPGSVPAVSRTLEDAPFYARSVISTSILGERVVAVHESLSLDRFAAPWVQAMLPFRMPRRFF